MPDGLAVAFKQSRAARENDTWVTVVAVMQLGSDGGEKLE